MAVYDLKDSDVKNAVRVLNRPSTAGELYAALRDLIGNAEKVGDA